MAKPDLDRLILAIDAAEQSAYGSEGDSDLQTDRALAIDFYHGRNVEPAPEGRSQIVDRTVFETVQWILPSLCRIFANGDSIVEFQPFGPEDEEGARQESDYLNYLVTQKNPWFSIFLTWAQDALLSKNGYCMAYMEEKLHTEVETYERQSDESITLLTKDEGVEVIEFESFPDGEPVPVVDPATGQPAIDPMTGQPVMQQPMKHNITLRKVKPTKKLCFKVLPPERTKVDIDTDSFGLENCNYFEYFDDVTISHLRSLGFDVEDDIETDETLDETEEGIARDLYSEENRHDDATDPASRKVRARMIWIRHDTDGDGIAELQLCWRVGNTILERDGKPSLYPCTRIPVACVTPNINTHRHIGTSEADITADLQRVKTAILRQGLDGLYLATNPRHAVSNEVNLDDLLVSRPGGIVRMLENSAAIPGEGHVMPIPTENVFPHAIAGLEYMDQVRENRTGTNRYFTGVDQNALNKTATGIQQLSTMAAQRVEQIARIFSSGVEYLFSVAHELVIKSGHQNDVVKLRGQWVQVDPSSWKTGRDMKIVVGYGAGNKDALVSRLALLINAQKEAVAMGLRIASEQNIYETSVELTKASDFSAPQRFWTDPSTIPPPQPQPDPLMLMEQIKAQSAQAIKSAEIESNERIKQAELLNKDQLAQLDAEVKIVLERMRQGGNVDLERVRGSIKSEPVRQEMMKLDELSLSHRETTQSMAQFLGELRQELKQAIDQAVDGMNAPREVIRDKGGRVSGVRVNGKERKVQRDKDGRVTGLQ